MQMLLIRTHWPRPFLVALELAGTASARLPFGMPDPVLCGASAVALYTRDLWPVTALELSAADPRKLVAELFALGCRPSRDAWDGGLQHPTARSGSTSARRPNRLRVAFDLAPRGRSDMARLKVVGIEDLIAERVRDWLADGAPSGEHLTVLQGLVASARAGVGGPLRTTYLQRRLASETQGEVCIDDLPLEAGTGPVGAPRSIGLSEMQARIPRGAPFRGWHRIRRGQWARPGPTRLQLARPAAVMTVWTRLADPKSRRQRSCHSGRRASRRLVSGEQRRLFGSRISPLCGRCHAWQRNA